MTIKTTMKASGFYRAYENGKMIGWIFKSKPPNDGWWEFADMAGFAKPFKTLKEARQYLLFARDTGQAELDDDGLLQHRKGSFSIRTAESVALADGERTRSDLRFVKANEDSSVVVCNPAEDAIMDIDRKAEEEREARRMEREKERRHAVETAEREKRELAEAIEFERQARLERERDMKRIEMQKRMLTGAEQWLNR